MLLVGEAFDVSKPFPAVEGATYVHSHGAPPDAAYRMKEVRDVAAKWCPME